MAIQAILCIWWDPDIYCCRYKNLWLLSVMSYKNLVHAFPSCFFKIHFNSVFPLMPQSSKWFLSVMFSNKTFMLFHYWLCILYPSPDSIFFILSCNNIGWEAEIMKLTMKHFLQPLDSFSHLDLNILGNLFLIAFSEFFWILFGNVSILVMIAFPPLLINMLTVKI